MGLVGSADDAVGQGELDAGDQDLLDVGAANISVGNLSDADDLDGAGASAVAGSHVGVASLNSGVAGQLTVLLVHVVGTGARVVADPDTEVLDLEGLLLVDLVDADDLAVDLLDLLQLAHEVPEAGLGNNLVGGKEAHAEQLGGSILLGGEMATDQLVLVKLFE